MAEAAGKQRLDKWLWQARLFKTRSLSARLVSAGHVRLDGERVSKPAQPVSPGQVLTFAQGNHVRVIKVLGLGTRRGPASEAQGLYEDLTPETERPEPVERVGERPTKRNRRVMDAFRDEGW